MEQLHGKRWPDFIWGIGDNTVNHSSCKYYFNRVIRKMLFSMKIVSGNVIGNFYSTVVFNDKRSAVGSISNSKLNDRLEGEFEGINRGYFTVTEGAVFNNFKFYLQLEEGTEETDFEQHKSQTAIMPVQQEMLERDYIEDVEHHEWGKLVLTGNENFVQAQNANKLNYFYLGFNVVKIKGKIISNMLKSIESGIIWGKTSYDDIVSSASNSKTINIMLSDTTITTLQQFKEKLKELYNAGTPIIIYYKLAEPINLELTAEQKAIRDTKLYTYKNITNIDVSDELASIDVTYKKDLETEHNKLQKEIDEIKQLLSTTQTSALLLDNLQKDIESEVE
nr:MAG TPA: hypothetical protein [Caudoviricetes sp.]